MVVRPVCRDVLTRLAKYDGHFNFIFYFIPPVRHDDIVTIAYYRAPGWFEEQVGYASVFLTLPRTLGQLLCGAAFTGMRVEVHGRVHNLAGILNGRHDIDIGNRMNVVRLISGFQKAFFVQPVHDFVNTVLQSVFVLFDQAEHICRHEHAGILR